MDFNSITLDQEKAAVYKFKEHGKGLMLGSNYVVHNDENSQKWNQLVDTTIWSERHIKGKMLHLASIINTMCNDELIGDQEVMFSFFDEFDQKVTFTYVEAYTFLRAALRHRRNTVEYKEKKAKLDGLNKFIEDNKTLTEKRREARTQAEKLRKELNL